MKTKDNEYRETRYSSLIWNPAVYQWCTGQLQSPNIPLKSSKITILNMPARRWTVQNYSRLTPQYQGHWARAGTGLKRLSPWASGTTSGFCKLSEKEAPVSLHTKLGLSERGSLWGPIRFQAIETRTLRLAWEETWNHRWNTLAQQDLDPIVSSN